MRIQLAIVGALALAGWATARPVSGRVHLQGIPLDGLVRPAAHTRSDAATAAAAAKAAPPVAQLSGGGTSTGMSGSNGLGSTGVQPTTSSVTSATPGTLGGAGAAASTSSRDVPSTTLNLPSSATGNGTFMDGNTAVPGSAPFNATPATPTTGAVPTGGSSTVGGLPSTSTTGGTPGLAHP